MLSPLFQQNPDCELRKIASRSRHSTLLNRTLHSWHLCCLACVLVLNITYLHPLDHFSDLWLNLQLFISCSGKWEAGNILWLHTSKPMVFWVKQYIASFDRCLLFLLVLLHLIMHIDTSNWSIFNGSFWSMVLQTHTSDSMNVNILHDY